jgi:hypothetical protein
MAIRGKGGKKEWSFFGTLKLKRKKGGLKTEI